MPHRARYALLDRDGTILVERNYLNSVEDMELLPGALDGLSLLSAKGFGLIVITNQSGIARGLVTVEAVDAIHVELTRRLEAKGILLTAVYYCPHLPSDNCDCRKPRTGLAERAASDFGFQLSESLVIGDKASDIAFGRAIKARNFLVRTGYGTEQESLAQADLVVGNLKEAALRA